MERRQNWHFESKKGWINDPNGLIYFNGKYHVFFQYNPHDIRWGPMHWGHAVSTDLLHWEELPIALYPDMPYEDGGGCFSGSAIEHAGALYLFYTSASRALGQTQSLAVSTDGIHFEKHEGNPLIKTFPADGSADFRDPKVSLIDGVWHMVCGSGKDGVGKVLLFTSKTLTNWTYSGVLFESASYGHALECPDFFTLDGKYVLLFSRMNTETSTAVVLTGSFDGKRFNPDSEQFTEIGPHFYAPQTFTAADGRRIMIGWMNSWKRHFNNNSVFAGALSIPRELRIQNGLIHSFPVREAHSLLVDGTNDAFIRGICASYIGNNVVSKIEVLYDTDSAEVFINGGQQVITLRYEQRLQSSATASLSRGK